MNTLKKRVKIISSWIRSNKIEFIGILLILTIASFFRLWRISEYLPFLGDEGRDVRVVARLLNNFDLMFVGPRTSIGDMYLGPAYYYMIAPFLLLFNFSPVGPAVFVALLSICTVFLLWYMTYKWFGRSTAITSALLYAISPVVINFAKHSWNPNIMPFFSLLSVWCIWKIWKEQNYKWFIVLGFSLSFTLQSHYLALLLFPTFGIYLALSFFKSKDKNQYINYSIIFLVIFLFLMSPLVLFDSKHGWHNFNSVGKFFLERQETVSARPWNAIPLIYPFWERLVSEMLTFTNFIKKGAGIVIGGLFLISLYHLRKKESDKFYSGILILVWAIIGLTGLGLLKQNIYTHYFGFLYPVPFIIFGIIIRFLIQKRLKVLAIILLGITIFINLKQNPFLNSPQKQLQRVENIVNQINYDTNGNKFNFGLIAERNYEEGYLYFFERTGANVKEIDPQDIENTLAEILYVVCEDPICEPINHKKAEIANFGWVKIDKQWEVEGRKVFKLVHIQQ